ncbi:MAG: C25 family cysteine peptidase [Bacteroidota bacterium]
MKKILCIATLVFICNYSIFGANEITIQLNSSQNDELLMLQKTPTSFRLKSMISKVVSNEIFTEAGSFNNLTVTGFTNNFSKPGKPHLPVISKLIEIPYGANTSVNIISYDEEIIELSDYGIINKLMPAQATISKSTDPADVVFYYDQVAYQIDDFNDDELVTVQFSGTMRGVNIGQLIISPIRYNPVTNTLKIYTNLEFEVIFNNVDIAASQQIKRDNYSPMFESSFSQLLNYEPDQAKDAITVYPITYLIVADRMFEATLQPFILWKTKKGFKVIVGYTDVIGTTTTAIKTWIQGKYNTEVPKPTFVTLVGDIAQIPYYNGTTATHPTDLYYFTFDGASDYIPELYFGRMSAESTSELQVILDKTLMHEQYTWPDETFLDKCIMVAGVDGTYAASHGNGQIYYGIDNYFTLGNGYSNVYAYLYGTSTHPYQVMSSANSGASADIRAKISTGVGFANYTAHCSEDGWADPSFTRANISTLTNTSKYPVIIGNCCLSNKFNTSPGDCFGEMILYAPEKGAVNYIGGTNYSYWDEDFFFGVGVNSLSISAANAQLHTYANTERGSYDGVWHTHSEPTSQWFITAREMTHSGNLAVESSTSTMKKYYWEIYHNMGDPSIMTYLSIPTVLTVSYTDPITVGTSSLVVNTEQYAYVAISQSGVLLNAQYSGTGTSVTLTFPAFTVPGQADVVVTKQNRKPYIGTVDIISGSTNNDAMVTSIESPLDLYDCPQSIIPSVTIKNMGINNLTSVTVAYKIDGGTAVTYAWSGNLVQYGTAVVNFPANTLTLGTHSFDAYTSNPNGVTDEYPANDHLIKNYSVNNVAANASFTADETVFCAVPVTVTFTNTSTNATSYLWDFGDGTTSTDENPVHTYTVLGNYTVTLTADNGVCGNDVEVVTDYISIDPANPCEFIMPTTGTVTETSCSGTLFDSGGSADVYGDNENAIFVISPVGASSISLNFISFDVEPGQTAGECNYDYLDIHDGNSTAATLIGKYCNNNIPTTVSSTGGSITLHFVSDVSLTLEGFEMDWNCSIPTTPPNADFTSDVTSTCTGTIQFSDLSTNGPTSWLWDFGNGNTSTDQNPSYTYSASGTYSVTLTAYNAFGDDTYSVTDMITVNMPVAPTAIDGSRCGPGSVTLTASGTGDLEWYNAPTGGTLVNVGSPFITGSLPATTTYYVEDHIANPTTYNVGETNSTSGGGYFISTNQHGLIFDCATAFSLLSVEVNAQTTGNRVITLTDASDNVLQSATVNIPAGVSRINLNFDVPVGTGLKLMGPGSPYLYRNSTAVLSYPYEVPGVVSINDNTAGNLVYYYYFYDWEIEANEVCISPRTPVVATIQTPLVVDANITATTTSICTGDEVIFTASATNGGTTPNYNWFVNSVSVQNGTDDTFTSSTLSDGSVINCEVTSSELCNAGPDMSNNITIIVSSAIPVDVTIASNLGNTICAGDNVTFTATPDNGGTTPSYEWQIGGVTVGTGSAYSSTGLNDGDMITCILTSSLTCATGNPATSAPLTMTVNPLVNPSISILASSTTICSGETVNFTSTVVDQGTSPVYNWMVNGISVGSGSTYSSSLLSDGDVVTCELTSSEPCSPGMVVSNSIALIVQTNLPVSVSISSNLGNSICTGELVTFTANPTNEGSTPAYQWFLNSSPVGTNSTYSSSSLSSGDVISCELTSSLTCATGSPASSNLITMTVSSNITPTIIISASDLSVCDGEVVDFDASVSGEGATPTYDWQVNGVSVGSGSIYSSSTLNDGDIVSCILTSSSICASVSQVNSNDLTINVYLQVTPDIDIISNLGINICQGDQVTFTATPLYPGSSPVYEWYVNGNSVGSNSATYVTSAIADGDVVTCVLTSSEPCAISGTVTSNSLTFSVALQPVAAYYFSTNGPTLTLLNNSSNATSYLWQFGDGNTSSMPDPVHTYIADGLYTVVLIATNSCGSDTISYNINIIGVNVNGLPIISDIEIYPNPTNGLLTINLNNNPVTKLEIYDVLGKVFLTELVSKNIIQLDLSNMNQGVYFIKLYSADQNAIYKVVISK